MRHLTLILIACSTFLMSCTWDCNIESDAYMPTLNETDNSTTQASKPFHPEINAEVTSDNLLDGAMLNDNK